ncbi:uncharacterized protein MCYG_02657 [Microsporum canis CBS 113480]|uniref:Uncharacterized protein n=1 Tax=Arthroderma otae (strain ATCC MYA-4605 / CBS 113480) TaxID=554155 RepID=C5FGF3_ARTOC|nr:uncharacterized protein MCYG_02657 [Microsporum canis CBS 113480]EEQ29838.1 predicted protein [Microsporum canis CBS 113480]
MALAQRSTGRRHETRRRSGDERPGQVGGDGVGKRERMAERGNPGCRGICSYRVVSDTGLSIFSSKERQKTKSVRQAELEVCTQTVGQDGVASSAALTRPPPTM